MKKLTKAEMERLPWRDGPPPVATMRPMCPACKVTLRVRLDVETTVQPFQEGAFGGTREVPTRRSWGYVGRFPFCTDRCAATFGVLAHKVGMRLGFRGDVTFPEAK